jgi:hypothetical protein
MTDKLRELMRDELAKAAVYRELADKNSVDVANIASRLEKVLKESEAFSTGDFIINVATACYLVGKEEQLLDMAKYFIGAEALTKMIEELTEEIRESSQSLN